MLKKILASTTGANKNGASKVYYNGKQVYKAYIGSSLVYDVVNGRDFDFTYNSVNQKFTFTNWKQTVDGVANTTHFLVKDDPTIIVDLGAITGHNTTIKNISIPYNVSIANNSLVRAFYNCSNLTNASISNPSITNMAQAYYSCSNLKSSPFCGDKVTNMAQTYQSCHKLTGSPVCGPNVTDMSQTYAYCRNLTGEPVCGPNVTNMAQTYQSCHNLTGSPVCGPNVTNMSSTYQECYSLTGNAACGPNVTNMSKAYFYSYVPGKAACGNNVTNMSQAYAQCIKLAGPAACGPNVNNMYQAYYNCINLKGTPACGDKVFNMYQAYAYCSNLTGRPVIGNTVEIMTQAYYNCFNLTGAPICGKNIVAMSQAFANCYNLQGNMYLFSNFVEQADSVFKGRNTANRLNIYYNVGASSYSITTTHHTLRNAPLTGKTISWTDDRSANGCYYNAKENIYLYPMVNIKEIYKENELLVARYTMNSGANVVPEGTIEDIREVKVTSENYNPQFSLGTLGVDITSMKEITTSVGDFYYIDDYTDEFGYVQYRYGASDKDRVYLSVDSDTKNVFIDNMITSDSGPLEEVTLYIPGQVDFATMTTAEDTTNNNGTITRSVYLDESQAGKHPSSISFNGETNLLTIDKLKVDNIKDATSMFEGCTNLTHVNTSDWDTSKITKADYMFAGCSKLTKESFEGSSYGYDLKYESKTYTLNFNEEIKLFNYPSSEFNFITLSYPITEYEEGYRNFNPRIERDDMDGCTYYTFGNTEPVIITVYDDGSIYAYSDGPGGDFSLYLYNRHKHTFELPNVESASHIFDGCTNLL